MSLSLILDKFLIVKEVKLQVYCREGMDISLISWEVRLDWSADVWLWESADYRDEVCTDAPQAYCGCHEKLVKCAQYNWSLQFGMKQKMNVLWNVQTIEIFLI
jgi:hypothetical protein